MGILILITHKGDLQPCVWAEVVNKKAESRHSLIKFLVVTDSVDGLKWG
jgi:hypothetical protein